MSPLPHPSHTAFCSVTLCIHASQVPIPNKLQSVYIKHKLVIIYVKHHNSLSLSTHLSVEDVIYYDPRDCCRAQVPIHLLYYSTQKTIDSFQSLCTLLLLLLLLCKNPQRYSTCTPERIKIQSAPAQQHLEPFSCHDPVCTPRRFDLSGNRKSGKRRQRTLVLYITVRVGKNCLFNKYMYI